MSQPLLDAAIISVLQPCPSFSYSVHKKQIQEHKEHSQELKEQTQDNKEHS